MRDDQQSDCDEQTRSEGKDSRRVEAWEKSVAATRQTAYVCRPSYEPPRGPLLERENNRRTILCIRYWHHRVVYPPFADINGAFRLDVQ